MTTPAIYRIAEKAPVFPCEILTEFFGKTLWRKYVNALELKLCHDLGGVTSLWRPITAPEPSEQVEHCHCCAPEFQCWEKGDGCHHPQCPKHPYPGDDRAQNVINGIWPPLAQRIKGKIEALKAPAATGAPETSAFIDAGPKEGQMGAEDAYREAIVFASGLEQRSRAHLAMLERQRDVAINSNAKLRQQLKENHAQLSALRTELAEAKARGNALQSEVTRWAKWRQEQPWLAEIHGYQDQLLALTAERDGLRAKWAIVSKNYYDVADAICASSTSPEDLVRQAKALRADLAAARFLVEEAKRGAEIANAELSALRAARTNQPTSP